MIKMNMTFVLALISYFFLSGCNNKPDKTKNNTADSVKMADTMHKPGIIQREIAEDRSDVPEIIKKEISPLSKILSVNKGNLNLDNMDDFIIVTGKKIIDPQNQEDQLRDVMLYITREDSSLSLFAENKNIIDCYMCGGGMGDPFTGITIKNGYFSIEESGLSQSPERWVKIITFRFNKEMQNFYFHQYGYENYSTENDKKTYSELIKSRDIQVIPFAGYNKDNSLIRKHTDN